MIDGRLARHGGLGFQRQRSLRGGTGRQAGDANLRDIGPGPAERIAHDEQLVGVEDREVEGLGQRAALGIMDLEIWSGEFLGEGEGLGDGATGAGRPVAEKFRQRRLLRLAAHYAAITGEVFADGPGQDGAAGGLPVEAGGAEHGPLHVVLVHGHDAIDYFRGHAQVGKRLHRGGKAATGGPSSGYRRSCKNRWCPWDACRRPPRCDGDS